MNANHDPDSGQDFENKLREAVQQQLRHDPTPAWKAEILAKAEAAKESHCLTVVTPSTYKYVKSQPNWLLRVLVMLWVVILLLKLTTPGVGNHAISKSSEYANTISRQTQAVQDSEAGTSVENSPTLASLRLQTGDSTFLDLP